AADVARGRYMFGATGGCGCHTVPKGQPNAGGRKYEGAFGKVYSSNISPDRQTGIGGWTDEQIITAIRLGRRPNGERLLPVHPFPVFNGMAEEDLRAIVAFLRTTKPCRTSRRTGKRGSASGRSRRSPTIWAAATSQTATWRAG